MSDSDAVTPAAATNGLEALADLLLFLAQSPLFNPLPGSELAMIDARCIKEEIGRGDVVSIPRPGQRSD